MRNEMEDTVIADKYKNLQGGKLSLWHLPAWMQNTFRQKNKKRQQKRGAPFRTGCSTWICAHVRMHLLSFSARGLASNPAVMATPWVVAAVGGGMGLGCVLVVGGSRGGPGLEEPFYPLSSLSFSSSLCHPSTPCLLSFGEIQCRIMA